jgi:lysophospholipase L1-like esterase
MPYYTNLKKYGIECWQYPTSFNDSDFIDGAHLNYKGAKNMKNGL